MQARRIARELALLSISQLPTKPEKLRTQDLQDVLLAAVRTLTSEVHETLETAAAELSRSSDRLLKSETRTIDLDSAKAMVLEAIDLAQAAINRTGTALELPEFVQLANQKEVRAYAIEILTNTQAHKKAVDQTIDGSLEDWKLGRLARIDQDILRISVTEIMFLGIPEQVAINEAVEMAKKYSGDDGHRFINGVLRRVSARLKPGYKGEERDNGDTVS
jgi:transcription antitermination protein NusB